MKDPRRSTAGPRRLLGGLRSAAARLAGSFRKRHLDARLDEELRFHLDMQERDNLERGMSREEARRAALRSFGAVEPLKEQYRTRRGVPFLDTFAQDLRYALRMLRKSPGFTAVALLSLAFGIGTNVAIFSVVDALLLRPLPVPDAEQLVALSKLTRDGEPLPLFSYAAFRRLSAAISPPRGAGSTTPAAAAFSGLLAFTMDFTAMVRPEAELPAAGGASDLGAPGVRLPAGSVPAGGAPESARAVLVSGSFFAVLGVVPAAGRTFDAADDALPGLPQAAVLSYGYWQRRFGRDPRVVGRVLRVNGAPLTVVGVAPRGFRGIMADAEPDLFLPLTLRDAVKFVGEMYAYGSHDPNLSVFRQLDAHWLQVVARRRRGVSPARAAAALALPFAREKAALAALQNNPESRRQAETENLRLAPAGSGLASSRDRLATPLLILLAVAGMVLVIACANLANLLLARADRRHKEMAVRLSIGAGRLRLLRQLLTESLLLAGLGGCLGLLTAWWGSRLLVALMAGGAPLPLDVAIDGRKLAFATAVALLTGLAFGLAPALQATRVDLAGGLRSSRATAGRRPAHGPISFGRLLVAAQIGLSLVLLIGAGLFVRSLQNLLRVDTGFAPDHLVQMVVGTHLLGYAPPRRAALYDRVSERLAAVPGVASVGWSDNGLMSTSYSFSNVFPSGYVPRRGEDMEAHRSTVTPAYFATVGMPLLRGRAFGPQDRPDGPRTAVVNEAFVRRFFAHDSALGRRFGLTDPAHSRDYEVVGVVKDARYNGLRDQPPPMVYLAAAQRPDAELRIVEVRTGGPAGREPGSALAARLRRAAAEADPDLAVFRLSSMAEQVATSLARERAVANLTGFFGLLALLLAAVGLYGVMSYNVARRTHEIGLRLALGAPRANVLGLVLRDAAQLAAAGVAAGLLAALAATRAAASQLYGITAHDPATLLVAALAMALTALAAGYLPARRAAGTDPMVALRSD
jgi:putative ABC transport system permease protein